MGGEAAPLGEPWRASHRGGHDDAKALFEPHRHIISGGYRRTGDAKLLAGGEDAQHMPTGEEQYIAVHVTYALDHRIGPRRDLIQRFTAGRSLLVSRRS